MGCGNVSVVKEYSHSDFLYYKLVTLVPFFTAMVSIWKDSWIWLAAYLLWIAFHVLAVYRLLCTHCPHYGAREGKTYCHFIWATPQLYKKRNGALSNWEKTSLMVMLAFSTLFPVYWLINQIELLIIYFLSLAVLFATMMKYECTRCAHIHCPKNQGPEELLHTLS
jgi:hypothetical protein